MMELRYRSGGVPTGESLIPVPGRQQRKLAVRADPASGGKRKRRRDEFSGHTREAHEVNEADELAGEDGTFEVAAILAKRRRTMYIQGIQIPGLTVPKSMYRNWIPPLPISDEKAVLKDFLGGEDARKALRIELGEDVFTAVSLDCFSIYRPHKLAAPHRKNGQVYEMKFANEFVSLHDISLKPDRDVWYLDGVLHDGRRRTYVQRVPFNLLSIGGYENFTQHTVRSHIWLQSVCGQKHDVWYCLENPSSEYRRYYDAFLWLADFAKHLIDFMYNNDTISLKMLRANFYNWLQEVHGHDLAFQQWLAEYPDSDFRCVAAAHPQFLYNEARQLGPGYALHPIWGEVHTKMLNAVPNQEPQEKKTVVTPYVYNCFKSVWGKQMELRQPSRATFRACEDRKKTMRFTVPIHHHNTMPYCLPTEERVPKVVGRSKVRVGDVVQFPNDGKIWKGKDDVWYAYVQGIDKTKDRTALQIIWLYRPSETTCSKMHYPSANELFFSDHCNCGDPKTYEDEVVGKTSVAFFESSKPSNVDYFIRQKYVGDETAFVTLKESDFQCKCQLDPDNAIYQTGDTVLVSKLVNGPAQILEPVEIVAFAPEGSKSLIRVRRLLRRGRDYGHKDAEPNELVYSRRFENVNTKDIIRRCHVRLYNKRSKERKEIPPPYCRKGTGDAFYILCKEADSNVVGNELQELEEPFQISLRQGFDPTETHPQRKLRGLDLFSGGGNFGRGLEEGGALQMEWALDWNKWAMHSYRANLQDPNRVKLFYGSANDFFAQALNGKCSDLIPQLGEVDFISAGSPCQGFSNANQRPGSDQSLRNSSMIASVASYIDLYRPAYAILENVPSMASRSHEPNENPFAQMLCTLVGMGYQVQQFVLDAWSFGNPQSRSRLFILATAPGLDTPPKPPLTHSHPERTTNRSLGQAANGHRFGERYWGPTQLDYVTIGEATADLPDNHDGRVSCIPFPDHQVTRNESTLTRIMIDHIPRFPRSQTFVKACKANQMPPIQVQTFHWESQFRAREGSRSWERVNPNALVPTVTTQCQPADSFSGAWVHWDASRCLTVMEVRRAQGFPDQDVLVGSPAEQWKLVGNGVARQVALALGLSLRQAWLANGHVYSESPATTVASEIACSDPRITPTVATRRETGVTPGRLPRSTAGPRSGVPRAKEGYAALHDVPGGKAKGRVGSSKELAIVLD
ncbi:S-adenosyl-L-methionine-dependent methyltransferase-like [Lasallia pustulata]|uniref:Cytosine-specific methyltransferase n=1 Tax=Lasallia pustulata TaxID=136370 RepID=A0A1W5D1V1_9LECA|nr:S-adenosyl-L-methionine-dependent methyltransferase-like [Lasallia pustulata]